MTAPLYSAGQRVNVLRTRLSQAPGGIYKIIRALPDDGRPTRYRVKSDGEAFERIIDETGLEGVRYD
jgi:hypothetical protein